MTIDRARAEKAVEFLVESAAEYGAAKSDAEYANDVLKRIKAVAMSQSDEKSTSAQERDAYASEAYKNGMEEKRQAVRDAETLRAQRSAAEALIEFWRSDNANRRSAERGYGSAG